MKKTFAILLFATFLSVPLYAQTHHYAENGICTDAGCTDPYQPAELINGYYQLGNAGNVEWFSQQVNMGGNNIFLNAVLTADIDMKGVTHTPIGSSTAHKFNGKFDGQGHRILNMVINTTSPYQGFFGSLRGGGTVVQNLIIDKSCRINGGVRTGGIAGGAQTIADNQPIRIINCGNEANISSTNNGGGGILGGSESPHPIIYIENCYNSGTVKGTKECAAIAGWMGDNKECRITGCYNSGIVSGMDNSYRNLYRHAGEPFACNNYDVSSMPNRSQGVEKGMTRASLNNGELCYALNGDQKTIAWYQTIGTDITPTTDNRSKQVFAIGKVKCNGEPLWGTTEYANEPGTTSIPDHDFRDGFCVTCGTPDPNYMGTPRKVYLMGGQSNADGRAAVSSMPQYIRNYVNNGGSEYCYWSYANGSNASWSKFGGKLLPYMPYTDNNGTARCGFDGVVYHHIENTLQKRFYVIKESLGGTAINPLCSTNSGFYWCADPEWLSTASPRSGHSLLLELTENIGLCIDNVLSQLKEGYEIQCMMWHQGEADRFRAYDYEKNLRQVVTHIRQYLTKKTGDTRYMKLPFITGTVNRSSTQYNPIVEAAMWKLAKEDPNFHVVDFSDCQLGSDVLHFDATGNVTCGTRMFNKLVNLGLVEDADTIAVSQAPADTLHLTKQVITNYDFEFYESDNGPVLNDGTERKTGNAPYGWQHTWSGYPDTPFPSETYGIHNDATGVYGKSHCWYTPKGSMPQDFELFQEIPAGKLQPGHYRLSCLMGEDAARLGVTRLFANNNVTYFSVKSRYDEEKLRKLYPSEIISYAGIRPSSTEGLTTLKEVSVEFELRQGEDLRIGIRSSNLNNKGVESTINAMGAFTTDYWRLVRLGDATGIESVNTNSDKHKGWKKGIYDLTGRPLSKVPYKGIFIENGTVRSK